MDPCILITSGPNHCETIVLNYKVGRFWWRLKSQWCYKDQRFFLHMVPPRQSNFQLSNPGLLKTVHFATFAKPTWSGVFKVWNFVGRNKLVQNVLVSGVSWSERTNCLMVIQLELWTNLSVSICKLLIIANSDLDETFKKYLLFISFGIAMTTQNVICMIN